VSTLASCPNKPGRNARQVLRSPFGRSKLERDIPPFDIAQLAEPFSKRGEPRPLPPEGDRNPMRQTQAAR
jgi:hypothetical protein